MEGGKLFSVSADGQVADRMIPLASAFSFMFAGFLSVIGRIQGHVSEPSFDMIPEWGLAGMYLKS